MSKRIQMAVSDKNFEAIMKVIRNKEIEQFDGSRSATVSSVAAYFLDLGIRVYLSSKEGNKFDINGYRKELLSASLKSAALGGIMLNVLNELPEFSGKGINLISEKFLNNEKVQNRINELLSLYFD